MLVEALNFLCFGGLSPLDFLQGFLFNGHLKFLDQGSGAMAIKTCWIVQEFSALVI